jgi:cytochrome c biogenesis protein CcdA
LVCGYVALGLVAGALIAIAGASRLTYGALSAGLAIGGLVTLFGGRDLCSCHDRSRRRPTSAGGAFLLGASGTLVVSPCCTPLVAAIASLTIFAGHTREGTLLLGTFALGHVVPLALCAALGSRFGTVLARITVPHAPAIVAGTLMLALSAYYGLLA